MSVGLELVDRLCSSWLAESLLSAASMWRRLQRKARTTVEAVLDAADDLQSPSFKPRHISTRRKLKQSIINVSESTKRAACS